MRFGLHTQLRRKFKRHNVILASQRVGEINSAHL